MTTNLVYVMGHGFCGSTLLTFLLNAHPEIATCGEMGVAPNTGIPIDEYRCSCGGLIFQCAFWNQAAAGMRERGYDFDPRDTGLLVPLDDWLSSRVIGSEVRGPLFEGTRRVALTLVPSIRNEVRRLVQRNRAFIDVLTSLKGCNTFVDTSKRPERVVLLERLENVSLRVIYLIRDGRAVTFSSMSNLGQTPEFAAQYWVKSVRWCELMIQHLPPDRVITVRYEDLCRDPQATLGSIFKFIGVAPGAAVGFRDADHHIIGNRMRLGGASSIVLDERWKSQLGSEERRIIDAVVGEANARYGYPPEPEIATGAPS